MNKAMFVLGGPGSGKDYVITNILSKYNLHEIQIDQVLNGTVGKLLEQKQDIMIIGNGDADKIQLAKSILEKYEFFHTTVSVSNRVSRERNSERNRPLSEATRIKKWLDIEKLKFENCFNFQNSVNLVEATDDELVFLQYQIEEYLHFLEDSGFSIVNTKPKLTFKNIKARRKCPIVPPKNMNARIDNAGGYTLGPAGSGSGIGGITT